MRSQLCRVILSGAPLIVIFHLITLVFSSIARDHSSGLFENIANRTPLSAKIVAEYGTWLSPLTSDIAAGSEVQFDGLERDECLSEPSDTIYWVESRPAEDGRSVICSWNPLDKIVVPWTPENFSAQSTVHEFGGGAFCVYKGTIYFVNKSDQRIYMQRSPSDTPHSVTQHDPYRRFADLQYSEQFDCLIAVCEDKGDRKSAKKRSKVEYHRTKAKNLTDSYVVAINISTGELTCLVYGADFYSSPRTTPLFNGILVWMEWNFPNMHWDNTSIKWSTLNGSLEMPASSRVHKLRAANGKSDVMLALPQFTSSGELLYISDEDNWRNLWKTNLSQTRKARLEKVSKDLCDPLWIFGMHPYSIVPSSNLAHLRVALTYGDDLSVVESKQLSDKEVFSQRFIPTGFRHHTPYVQAVQSGIYAIGYNAKTPMTLLYTDSKSGKTTRVRSGPKVSLKGYLSEPQELEIPTSNNEVAYGYYYPPVNKNYEGPEGSTPPLRVRIHGGPTARTYAHLSLDTQFFTSRGFGVLDLNYRGSDGYGRKYREQLYGNWGISDMEDAVNGARYLVSLGKADPNRLVIIGGSAGGLTVLNSLIHYDTFKAGASYYGVADLETISAVTDKLQLHYLDTLVGPYPEAKLTIEERSPYHNRDKLNRPVIFFQGTKDNVVPPSQSRKMYEAVKAKGLPTAYVSFEGESHGFVKKKNIRKALEAEYAFYLTVFGMEAPSVPNGVKFDNI